MKKGSKHTPEAIKKMRLASINNAKINPNYGHRGKPQSENNRLALLKANLGSKHSEEHKKKMSELMKGEKNPMYGTKGELCPFFGRHHTPENCEKMRLSKLGKNNPSYGKRGELSYRWNGGTSFMPYDKNWNNRFKESIKERDKCCMLCNACFPDTLVFHVHHIDYNKENTIKENCITLCHSCHSKTNTRRKEWIELFHEILSDEYGYDYQI